MNWREYPFVRLLLPLIGGICLAFFSIPCFPILRFPFLLFGLFLLLLYWARPNTAYAERWHFGLLATLFFLTLGYQLTYWQDDWNRSDHFRHTLDGEAACLIGEVVSLREKADHWQTCLEVKARENDRQAFEGCTGRLLVRIPKTEGKEISLGAQVMVRANILRISPPGNPANFDYAFYMRVRNIYFQAFPKPENIHIRQEKAAQRLSDWLYKRQQKGVDALYRHLPDRAAFGVAAALILGDRDNLSVEVKEAYSQTGAMHVLAVSGLHVGLVTFFLTFLLARIRWKGKYATWIKLTIQLVGIWGFALLTGGSPSVLRAATMFSLFLFGRQMQRYTNIYNTLAASAFLLLALRPNLLLDLGFQLSYLAVLGIVYFQPRIFRSWYVPTSWGRFVWKLTAVSLAAQITTLPVSLYYFHQFPLYFWLSGLVVVPAAMVILPLGLLLLLASAWPGLAAVLGLLLGWIIGAVNLAVEAIQQLPGHLFTGIWIGLSAVILLYGLILCLVLFLETRHPRWIKMALGVCLLLGAQHLLANWQALDRRQIVFYQVYRHSALDFLDGKTSYALVDTLLEEPLLERISNPYLWSQRAKRSLIHGMGQVAMNQGNWWYHPGFVQFHDQRLAIVTALPENRPPKRVKVDFLLLRDNPTLEVAALREFFVTGQVIFDGSNARRRVDQWKEQCRALGIPYHDLSEDGALIVDIGK